MTENRIKIFYPKSLGILLKDAFIAWKEDKAWRLGAALAYFTIFSLAPLLIIIITITSAIFGEQAVRGQIFSEFQGLIGTRGANAVQSLLENAYMSGSSLSATILGTAMLIFGSTAVFVQLRQAINTIWEIADKPINTVRGFVKARVVSFAVILGFGVLVLISLLISTLLNIFSNYLGEYFPFFSHLMQVIDFSVSFGFTTVMFALIFKILPNARIKWKDIWIGSAFISFLFTIGKMGISFYLSNSNIASSFGAASSLAIILLWTFYSAQIFLFGAEFTKIFADRFGGKVLPGEHAVKLRIEKVEFEDGDS
ncbi:YihY family inner membrane protein [candidate division KSB1 bacterium]|nr:YihY family inner membrane protein [candidate division KSB1 bacterium]